MMSSLMMTATSNHLRITGYTPTTQVSRRHSTSRNLMLIFACVYVTVIIVPRALLVQAVSTCVCALFTDFRRRFIALMSFSFRAFEPSTCMMILQQKHFKPISKGGSDCGWCNCSPVWKSLHKSCVCLANISVIMRCL